MVKALDPEKFLTGTERTHAYWYLCGRDEFTDWSTVLQQRAPLLVDELHCKFGPQLHNIRTKKNYEAYKAALESWVLY